MCSGREWTLPITRLESLPTGARVRVTGGGEGWVGVRVTGGGGGWVGVRLTGGGGGWVGVRVMGGGEGGLRG